VLLILEKQLNILSLVAQFELSQFAKNVHWDVFVFSGRFSGTYGKCSYVV